MANVFRIMLALELQEMESALQGVQACLSSGARRHDAVVASMTNLSGMRLVPSVQRSSNCISFWLALHCTADHYACRLT